MIEKKVESSVELSDKGEDFLNRTPIAHVLMVTCENAVSIGQRTLVFR